MRRRCAASLRRTLRPRTIQCLYRAQDKSNNEIRRKDLVHLCASDDIGEGLEEETK
jgi:hypothetical protein